MSIGYGTYQLSKKEETYKCVTSALEIGYTVVDTAALYRNELETFRAIKDYLVKTKKPRSEIIVTSKIWLDDFDSAKLNDIEYLDVLYLHNPLRQESEIVEKWKAMNNLDKNKIRKLGVSNFSLDQLKSLNPLPQAIQVEYAKLTQEMVDWCKSNNVDVYVHSCIRRFKLNTHYDNFKDNLQRCKDLKVVPVIGSKQVDFMKMDYDLMVS